MRRIVAFVSLGVAIAACGGDDPGAAQPSGGGAGGAPGAGGAGVGGAGGATCPAGSHVDPEGGCEASLAGWTEGPPLAGKRDHHLTFVVVSDSGPHLYAAGGVVDNSTLLDDIELSPIQPDGSIGSWSAVAAKLPGAAAGAGVAVVGTTVVVTAGYRTTPAGSPTLSAATDVGVVQPDGTIGSWASGPDLGATRFHHAMVADGARLYVIGGLTGDNTDNTPNVERADVTGAGTVGAWTEVTPLPTKRSHHSAAVHEHAIYVTGGLEGDPAGPHTTFDDVLRAEIQGDGTLGAWIVVGQLPTSLTTHSSFAHAGALYVLAGIEDGANNTIAVRRAAIGEAGVLGPWEDVAPLPKPRAHAHQTALHEGFAYAVAGAHNHVSSADVFIGRFE